MTTAGMPGRFTLKRRLEALWDYREREGNCQVCGTKVGRWVCVVHVGSSSFRLCSDDAKRLAAQLTALQPKDPTT